MKAYEIMNHLFAKAARTPGENTVDTLKAGDPNTEVTHVAVSMFATPEVIREAHRLGANLLVVHEPTFYDHFDRHLENDPVTTAKETLLKETGITLYRYHDFPHNATPDLICAGVAKAMDLDADMEFPDFRDLVKITLHTPMTAVELAAHLENRLGIRHIKISGSRDLPATKLSLMCGTPGGVFDELHSEDCEILLTGEACEWQLGEYARDASQMGFNKTLMVLGHIGSERDGMELVAELLKEELPAIQVSYIECGEVYSYTN
ncbi:MAG: Nif3-like dinuclear metal center hexameric protein [Clostridia bacterium]|nr:Nif3-like dinuclear metal center hexameric protein [Clostridia bacterium]